MGSALSEMTQLASYPNFSASADVWRARLGIAKTSLPPPSASHVHPPLVPNLPLTSPSRLASLYSRPSQAFHTPQLQPYCFWPSLAYKTHTERAPPRRDSFKTRSSPPRCGVRSEAHAPP